MVATRERTLQINFPAGIVAHGGKAQTINRATLYATEDRGAVSCKELDSYDNFRKTIVNKI